MTDLITRLEEAEEGSRELDAAIWRWTEGWRGVDHPPAYTTSIDAALALAERVLPEWAWSIIGPDPLTSLHDCTFACLSAPEGNGAAESRNADRDVCTARASTPALALCIVILKATPQGQAMTTMIEKMAEAIARQMAEDQNDNLDLARAALMAIREDLPASIIRAGDNADYFCSEGIHISRMICDDGIQTVFTAMIDAILDGKE
jgi:hypothetical protein